MEINTFVFRKHFGRLRVFKKILKHLYKRLHVNIFSLRRFLLFSFMSGIMAFIDTVRNFLHYFNMIIHPYTVESSYYDNIVMNWLWLFLVYVMFCCLLYLTILIINKIGKTMSIYCGILFIGCIVLITALFRYVFSAELVKNILNFFMKAAGFVKGDTINYFYPSFSLLLIIGILGTTSFVVIRRTELK